MPKELNPNLRPQLPPARIDVGSCGAQALKKAITDKLIEFLGEYTDDVLAEYILVMMAHGKTRDQTMDDLEAFLGPKNGRSFTDWLWENMTTHRRTYEKQAEGDAVAEPAKEAVAKQQTEQETLVEGSKPLPVEE
eukprot:CAMPEP_0198220294 /NCGR_PEP_ID=MMETSP1445-20131203/78461_1 /TAXON_ID=36898 /ORGANISM="Pyramimonas sp., Strain CCMP2087" /LENGTH=134 /DNA_ID=CAMNT_0043898021 /DNA_START=374 /DNA_END=775 /DNA_ORIENTATION=+